MLVEHKGVATCIGFKSSQALMLSRNPAATDSVVLSPLWRHKKTTIRCFFRTTQNLGIKYEAN